MKTKIKVSGETKNKTWTVTGWSGSGVEVGQILRSLRKYNSEAREFLAYLSHLAKDPPMKRSPFSCAEPHAVALLLKAGCTLDSIIFPIYAIGQYGEIEACYNCSEWISCGGVAIPEYKQNKIYTSKDYDQESNLSNVKPIKLNFNDKNEFPSLSNNNNNNNSSANKWKKFTKDFN